MRTGFHLHYLFPTVFLFCVISSAQAADAVRVHFPSLEKKNGTPVELNALWFKSSSPGKRPTILALHGCGGLYSTRKRHEHELTARHQTMAELLQSNGYNVLFVDSFTSRGTRSVCTSKYKERDITTDIRRLDVQGTLQWLATQKEVDHEKIALLGWSMGGSTVLNSINKQSPTILALKPKAAVTFYPGCDRYIKKRDYTIDTPLLIMIGEKDDWTPAQSCVQLKEKLKLESMTVRVYADSYHDFDAPNLPIKLRTDVPNGVNPGKGVTTGSNPPAREAAYKEMLEFLVQQLLL